MGIGQSLDGQLVGDGGINFVLETCNPNLTPGAGCLFNGRVVMSTEPNCPEALGHPEHKAVCKRTLPEYLLGGTDGSCPVGATRVQMDECGTLIGQSLDGQLVGDGGINFVLEF